MDCYTCIWRGLQYIDQITLATVSYQLQLELFQCLLVFHYVDRRTLRNGIYSLYELGVVFG